MIDLHRIFGLYGILQPDQINMAALFWYPIKSVASICYCTVAYNEQVTFYKVPETHDHVTITCHPVYNCSYIYRPFCNVENYSVFKLYQQLEYSLCFIFKLLFILYLRNIYTFCRISGTRQKYLPDIRPTHYPA